MLSRILALFAFLTLTLVSAASAHEHGPGHALSHPAKAATPAPIALSPTAQTTDQSVIGQATADGESTCADRYESGHSHGKTSGCACPATCAGLFDVVMAAWALPMQISAEPPLGARRLVATSAAPPTPPPRG